MTMERVLRNGGLDALIQPPPRLAPIRSTSARPEAAVTRPIVTADASVVQTRRPRHVSYARLLDRDAAQFERALQEAIATGDATTLHHIATGLANALNGRASTQQSQIREALTALDAMAVPALIIRSVSARRPTADIALSIVRDMGPSAIVALEQFVLKYWQYPCASRYGASSHRDLPAAIDALAEMGPDALPALHRIARASNTPAFDALVAMKRVIGQNPHASTDAIRRAVEHDIIRRPGFVATTLAPIFVDPILDHETHPPAEIAQQLQAFAGPWLIDHVRQRMTDTPAHRAHYVAVLRELGDVAAMHIAEDIPAIGTMGPPFRFVPNLDSSLEAVALLEEIGPSTLPHLRDALRERLAHQVRTELGAVIGRLAQ